MGTGSDLVKIDYDSFREDVETLLNTQQTNQFKTKLSKLIKKVISK